MWANLRQNVRTRLISGDLFPTDGNVSAGKSTAKSCIVCGMTIVDGEIEHKVVGATTVWAHWDCYSIWRQESDTIRKASRQSRRADPMTERKNDDNSDDVCVVCGKPIKAGEGRFLIDDRAAHVECYEKRQTPPAKP